jgi:ABC-type siderophore export system fused ATPase/permease subunit
MWAIGVWGGLAGSILLLMRSRHSVVLFALSFIGAVIGLGYQVFLTDMPLSMRAGLMGMMPWVIVIITVSLLWYSWAEKDKGDLR